nr:unnamed protein product [Callosobruchus analis]
MKRGALSQITVHKETRLPGGNVTYTGKRFSHIKRAFIHQHFGIPTNSYNDLALLRLRRPLRIHQNQTRVVLPTKVENVEEKFKNQPLHMTRYCSTHNSVEFKDAWPQDRSLCDFPYNKASFNKVFCALFQEERKTKFKDANDMGGPVVSSSQIIYLKNINYFSITYLRGVMEIIDPLPLIEKKITKETGGIPINQ